MLREPKILTGQEAEDFVLATISRARQNEQAKLKKVKDSTKDKEEFSIEKLVPLYPDRYKDILKSPSVIEDLEVAYYLHHPEFKTLAEFVSYELSTEDLR